MSTIYSGDVQGRAISTSSLDTRLAVNTRYQSVDFHAWLMRRLDVGQGEHILDVGCGTGAQTLRFLGDVGATGTVSALDIAAESVATLKAQAGDDPRLQAEVSDMADLRRVVDEVFAQKQYTLAQSAYALYYSPARLDVLATMADCLVPHGRVAVFTPCHPHGMVELAARFGEIPAAIPDSLSFGEDVLAPWLRERFWDVRVDYFQSLMRVTSLDDFVSFYRATTYYREDVEPALTQYAREQIATTGALTYEKCGFLIQGSGRR